MPESCSLTLRRGNVTLLIDMPGVVNQKQWDAIGAMFTRLWQLGDQLNNAHSERTDIAT